MIELNDFKETKRSFFNKKDFFAPKPKTALEDPLIAPTPDDKDPLEPVNNS
jgi:hypothetical protein